MGPIFGDSLECLKPPVDCSSQMLAKTKPTIPLLEYSET